MAELSQDAKLANNDYVEAMSELRSAMEDIIGINISDQFAESAENLDLMQSYLDGNTESLEALRAAALQDIIIGVSTNESDLTEI